MFKEIKEYEGLYEVSEEGTIRSLDRYIIDKNGKKKFYPGRVLRQSLMHRFHTSYAAVTLSKNGKLSRHSVHRIVATAFLTKPKGKDIVNHIDNNGLNNHYKNLEWVTHQENMLHAQKQGRLFKAQSAAGKIGGNIQAERSKLISDRYIGLTINNWKILSYDTSKAKKYVIAECLLCNTKHSVYLSTITTDVSKQCVSCGKIIANKLKQKEKINSVLGTECNNLKVLKYAYHRSDGRIIMETQCLTCDTTGHKTLNSIINKTAKCNLPSGRKKI